MRKNSTLFTLNQSLLPNFIKLVILLFCFGLSSQSKAADLIHSSVDDPEVCLLILNGNTLEDAYSITASRAFTARIWDSLMSLITGKPGKSFFEKYNLLVPNLESFKVRDQGDSPTCVISACSSYLELNGYLPEGFEIDPQYIDGMRIWQKAAYHLDKKNNDIIMSSQLDGATEYNEFFNIILNRAVKLRPISDSNKMPKMFDEKQRDLLSNELQGFFKNTYLRRRLESEKNALHAELAKIMQKYYGSLEPSIGGSINIQNKVLVSYKQSDSQSWRSPNKVYKYQRNPSKINPGSFDTDYTQKRESPRAIGTTEDPYIKVNAEVIEKMVATSLKEGKSLIFSMAFNDKEVSKMSSSGKIKGPVVNKKEPKSGHALLIVGAKTNADESIDELLILNSWGARSGQYGYVTVKWKDLASYGDYTITVLKDAE